MNRKNKIAFPKKGRSGKEILKELEILKKGDIDWKAGKSFGLVYYPGENYALSIQKAYELYFNENALNPQAFPSLQKCQNDIVSMMNELFHAPENAAGILTSGGTESILLTVKTARDYSKSMHKTLDTPEILLPVSAHPAFLKAAHYFGMKAVIFSVDKQGRASNSEAERLINRNTVLLVGSAPSFPHGVIDDIEGLSKLALQHNVLMHVDCCIGGFMLPFLKRKGYDIPSFDFQLKGVTSISADIHKYGYSSKGASVILYRHRSLRKHQFSVYTKWPGGIYGSPSMLGTKAGGAIAAAWTALQTIGEDGYMELADKTMKATHSIIKAIESVPELKVIAEPKMSLIAFTSDQVDIFEVGDELNLKGWSFGRLQNPNGIHLVISQVHYGEVTAQFIKDLKEAVSRVKRFSIGKIVHKIQVNSVKFLAKILPEGFLPKVQRRLLDPVSNKRSAAMYGMMGVISGDDLDEIVRDILDRLNSLED